MVTTVGRRRPELRDAAGKDPHVTINHASADAAALEAKAAGGSSASLLTIDLPTPAGITAVGTAVRWQTAMFMNGGSPLSQVQEFQALVKRGSSVYQISSRGSKLAQPGLVTGLEFQVVGGKHISTAVMNVCTVTSF